MMEQYRPIKIKVLKIYGDGIGLDLFFQMKSGKILKVNHQGDCPDELLDRYELRGVEELHLLASDFDTFVNSVRERLKAIIDQKSEDTVHQAKALSSAHEIFRTIFSQGDFDETKKKMLAVLTQGTIKYIKKLNIYEHYQQFYKQVEEHYLHALMTSFLTSAMIDQFSWSNDEVKEKVVMAAMLCDIGLTRDEFLLMKETLNHQELPHSVLEHPINIAAMVEEDSRFVPAETLTIIRQHHERPNGKGYPKGISYKFISNLTAIYIVANYFAEQVFDSNYEEVKKDEITRGVLLQIKEKFYSGPFRKSSDSLLSLFPNLVNSIA